MGFNSGLKVLTHVLPVVYRNAVKGYTDEAWFIQKNPTRCNSVSKFIIPYLYETQHVSGDTPSIIRSL